MIQNILETEYISYLLQRQSKLEEEAQQVILELRLMEVLSKIGQVHHIGSSSLGLMVNRDIDFQVLCKNLLLMPLLQQMLPVVRNPGIIAFRYDYRNPSGNIFDRRHYIILSYKKEDGSLWQVEIAFWHVSTPYQQWQRRSYIQRALSPEVRTLILWLKDMWHHYSSYAKSVSSKYIYDAVFYCGVSSPLEFRDYLESRSLLPSIVPSIIGYFPEAITAQLPTPGGQRFVIRLIRPKDVSWLTEYFTRLNNGAQRFGKAYSITESAESISLYPGFSGVWRLVGVSGEDEDMIVAYVELAIFISEEQACQWSTPEFVLDNKLDSALALICIADLSNELYRDLMQYCIYLARELGRRYLVLKNPMFEGVYDLIYRTAGFKQIGQSELYLDLQQESRFENEE